ncbi:hypothetical protein Agub_g1359 [Astrephomene gubernaculifera]|uniref:EF-hand domain-containing protein n=1 Tax=Astrephomene gubernaculifera TaxID=47775 RepID=A0AAD3DGB6_9CHLO|nr:hypothetical protein Agub_g1359 [Astrephomene gubernaculifera]
MLTISQSRSSTRVQAPPGGHSSISLGGAADPPLSPTKAAAAPEADVAPPETSPVVVVAEPETADVAGLAAVEDGPSLELLKLQAIGALAGAEDAPEVRDAITVLLKQLQIASAAKKENSEEPGLAAPVDAEAAAAATDPGSVALAALKTALKLRGTHGIISIGRKFRSMDEDGDRKLSYDEFKRGLLDMKLGMSEADMTRLFRHFDKDASGYITFDELLYGLRGELNERRLEMVRRCFKVLDKKGEGKVTLADMERRYDASRHPDVVAGTKTQRMVLLEFLGVFESAGGGTKGDGLVEFEEFKSYYTQVSANIDPGNSGDDYFELMMRNVWHVSGGEGWCANTTCKRVLVVLEDDTQNVMELTDDFDVDVKDLTAVKAKLAEQGVTGIKSVALYGDMAAVDSISGGGGSGASTPRGSPAPSSEPTFRPSTGGRRGGDHNRSSIIFG